MSLLVKLGFVLGRRLPSAAHRHAGNDALFFKCLAEPDGIVTTIGQKALGRWQCLEHGQHALRIAHLARRQEESQRAAKPVEDHVQL